MIAKHSQPEIDEQVARAEHVVKYRIRFAHGKSYEQGIVDALRWVTGEATDKPLSDEDYSQFDGTRA